MCVAIQRRSNPIRGPINALFFTALDGYINRLLAKRKSALFQSLPHNVVELGPGVGANFRYLPKGATLTAVEPNPHMHKGLRKRAEKHDIDLRILANGAEAIELPDNSVEAVICTLVLCTVDDLTGTLKEVRRILQPGGQFLFLEHVAAPEGHWRRRLQNTIFHPWRYFFEGCRTNRNTADYLRSAGFEHLDIEEYTMTGPFIPVNTQISGVATA